MFKKLSVIILKFFIVALCLTIIAYSAILLLFYQRDNWFNDKFRDSFSYYPYLRTIFKLHDFGDGKGDYLNSKKFPKLLVEIDSLDGYELSSKAKEEIPEDLQEICQKPEDIEIIEDDTIYDDHLSFTIYEIEKLQKDYRNYYPQKGQAVLYIICLNKFADSPTNIGTTTQETSMAIFEGTISDLPNYKDNQLLLEKSTILHEFGHLLALDHSESPYSVMSETVEVVGREVDIRTCDFSEEDLREIEELREKYY